MEIWAPVLGEILVVKIEAIYRRYTHAVAIYVYAEIVYHVPYNLVTRMSAFFMSENKVFTVITRGIVYRGAGSGVPCVYRLYIDLTFMLTKSRR